METQNYGNEKLMHRKMVKFLVSFVFWPPFVFLCYTAYSENGTDISHPSLLPSVLRQARNTLFTSNPDQVLITDYRINRLLTRQVIKIKKSINRGTYDLYLYL